MSDLLSKIADMSAEHDSAAADENRIMNELIKQVQAEQPKIDSAIKNLLAVLLSRKPPTSLPTQTPNEGEDYIPPAKAMECAKVFLKSLQAYPLLSIDEFCRKFPQNTTQSANERLDEVCKYKAFYALKEHTLKTGMKVSKTFGRSYFTHTKQWDSLKESTVGNIPDKLAIEELEIFLKVLEKSIFANGSPTEGDQDLIWSVDFNAALRSRQAVRTQMVAKRVEEADAAAALEIAEIVDAVRREERVEELPDEEETV